MVESGNGRASEQHGQVVEVEGFDGLLGASTVLGAVDGLLSTVTSSGESCSA